MGKQLRLVYRHRSWDVPAAKMGLDYAQGKAKQMHEIQAGQAFTACPVFL
jgi:hypothetical protein